MKASTWLVIAIVGFSIAGVALVAAVIIFILMDIPAVIGDLTGRTVAKEIKAIRASNASSGNKIHRPSRVNLDRGMLTEPQKNGMTDGKSRSVPIAKKSAEIGKKAQTVKKERAADKPQIDLSIATDKLSDREGILANTTETLSDEATMVLDSTSEILSDNETEVLEGVYTERLNDETQVLVNDATVVLEQQEENEENQAVSFKVSRNVVIIHTDETITAPQGE